MRNFKKGGGNLRSMANLGKELEEKILRVNELYEGYGVASVQKVETPWKVVRKGSLIVDAFPYSKSTLDFRGTVKNGIPISFDCKETVEEKGLPLANIKQHQFDYMRTARKMGEISFIIADVNGAIYYISAAVVLEYYDNWRNNKGKRGFNYIPVEKMQPIKDGNGVMIDYVSIVKSQK
jgi:recombination protein U